MKRFFDSELETFRSHLILMGEIAVRQVRDATKALVEGDPSLADRVVAADDELDNLELKIDEEAIRYMNLRSPVATELRLIIVGMKAAHDLERVGDETTNIARRVVRLAADRPEGPFVDLPRMASIAIEMLRAALVEHRRGDDLSRPGPGHSPHGRGEEHPAGRSAEALIWVACAEGASMGDGYRNGSDLVESDAAEHRETEPPSLTGSLKWGGQRDSNPRPLESQSSALTN